MPEWKCKILVNVAEFLNFYKHVMNFYCDRIKNPHHKQVRTI